MATNSYSLVRSLDTPIVVGDPDGLAVYANPSFQESFDVTMDDVTGQPLASLFEGGAREAVLQAVADVCSKQETIRFRVRMPWGGYTVSASPIEADDETVGVILMLTPETLEEIKVRKIYRTLQEPLDRLIDCLNELQEQTGGRRAARYRLLIDEAMRKFDSVKKQSSELGETLGRRGTEPLAADELEDE